MTKSERRKHQAQDSDNLNGGKRKRNRQCKLKLQFMSYNEQNQIAFNLAFMDNFFIPLKSQPLNPISYPRTRWHRWKRSAVELNGRFDSEYRHDISSLLMDSYSKIGAFPHLYHVGVSPCSTHVLHVATEIYVDTPLQKKPGISALDFDNKGIYLVSVTKSGCLTVHDFESLYLQCNHSLSGSSEDETKLLLHLSLNKQLDFVRWNAANQDEVVCTSMKSDEVQIFDLGYISSEPVEVLQARQNVTSFGSTNHKGMSDIAFTSLDNSRLLASDTCGSISMWDRRTGTFPCLELTSNSNSTLNRIQLNAENQIVFGAGKHGIIYMWDLRGGRKSTAFQSHKEACQPPLASFKLSSKLEKIISLKEQSNIITKEIHSIDINPACQYQLAFHLDDGWSGVLDIYSLKVTHVHCPPPAWLDDSNLLADPFYLRKPSWLPTNSIYAVGSSSNDGVHLLDFHPNPSSPSHVDYRDELHGSSGRKSQNRKNRLIPLSEGVTVCAAHPLNDTIIAGTKNGSLLVLSQKQHSC